MTTLLLHLTVVVVPKIAVCLLTVLLALCSAFNVAGKLAADHKSGVVCLQNVANNPRTASLFELGTLNAFGSEFFYVMDHKAQEQGIRCDHRINLVEENLNNFAVRACSLWYAIFRYGSECPHKVSTRTYRTDVRMSAAVQPSNGEAAKLFDVELDA